MIVTSIFLTATLFMGFGVAIFIWPKASMAVAEITLSHPSALTEIRTYYGAFEIGVGLFLLYCLWARWYEQALFFTVMALGFIVAGRFAGLMLDGVSGRYTIYAIAIELPFFLLNAIALYRFRYFS